MLQSPAYAEVKEMPVTMTVDDKKLDSVLRTLGRPALAGKIDTAEDYQKWLHDNGALLKDPE